MAKICEKREIMAINFDFIPHDMKAVNRWVIWRYEEGARKVTKVPYQTNGKKASATSSLTWTSFDAAKTAYSKGGFDGVGFVLGGGFVGIDLDHKIKDGAIDLEAIEDLKLLDSYAEFSPSGEGIHIICQGEFPETGRKDPQKDVEVYATGRYFTITGNRLEGYPTEPQHRTDALLEFYKKYFIEEPKPKRRKSNSMVCDLSEDQIIARASEARNSQKFLDLMSGNRNGFPSQSEADLALCDILASYTGNPDQIDRIFRSSKLYRNKWERSDYRERTINKAIECATNHYVDNGEQARTDAEPTTDIIISDRYLQEVSDEALKALIKNNISPKVFVRSGQLVRLVDKEHLVIDALNENALRGMLARAAGFVRVTKNSKGMQFEKENPPLAVVKDILTLGAWPGIPQMEGIIETPVIRADGTILSEPGYDAVSELYYAPGSGLRNLELPDQPSQADAERAAKYILDEILADFPFKDQASRANALGLLISVVLRPAIDGCVPLALIDKPSPGTGASLLTEIVATIATGRPANMMGVPETEDEWRKSITSCLLDGSSLIVIDNVVGTLRSSTLTRALTSRSWRDRFLGKSEMLDLPQRAVWMATGNNVSIGGDLARRSYWIRMDAAMARPWLRDEFKHKDILGWVKENQADLLSTLITMAQAWFLAGKPQTSISTIGGFKDWAQIVGGVLAFSGVTGFLENAKDLYDNMDQDVQQWDLFLGELREIHADNSITTGTLRDELTSGEEIYKTFQEAMPEDIAKAIEKGKKNSLSLANVLNAHRDQIYPSGRKLCGEKDSHRKQMVWKVVDLSAGIHPQDKTITLDNFAGVDPIRREFSDKDDNFQNIECMEPTPATPANASPDSACGNRATPANQIDASLQRARDQDRAKEEHFNKQAENHSKKGPVRSSCIVCDDPNGSGHSNYYGKYCSSCGPRLSMVKAVAQALAVNGNRPTTEEIHQALADRGRPPHRDLLPAMLREVGCIEEDGGWKWQSYE
jgi:hypothetical protein